MNTEEIIEGNKLIAGFMGGTILPSGVCDNYNKLKLPRWAFLIYNFDTIKVGGYEYHSSWDWLMPLVDKIEALNDLIVAKVYVSINDKNCGIWTYFDVKEILRITGHDTNESGKFKVMHHAKTKIEAVWLAVVEFIKWYNQNKDK